jgi:predicted amidohydrolase YtcJ
MSIFTVSRFISMVYCIGFSLSSTTLLAQDTQPILLVNGNIITLDSEDTVVNSVLIEDGRFVSVGDISPATAPDAQVIDLNGRTVVPGLIDSHMHFVRGTLRPGHDLRTVESTRSIDELLQAISLRAVGVPDGELISIVGGWDPVQFLGENRFPTLIELDGAAPDHPVYMHLRANGPGVTNSTGKALLEAEGIAVASDGMIAMGRGAGNAIAAWGVLKASQTEADLQRGAAEFMSHANSLGLTTIIDAAGTNRPGAQLFESDKDYKTIYQLWRENQTSVRLRLMYMSWDDNVGDGSGDSEIEQRVRNSVMGLGDDMLRVVALGEHTVSDNKGAPFIAATALAARNGWSLQQHSSSREENLVHLTAFEQANEIASIGDLRWSLTHVHQITPDIISRLQSLGAGVTVQDHRYLNRGNVESELAGPPLRMLVDSGLPLGAGTDSTNAQPMNPWYSIYYMVSGKNVVGNPVNADQKINRIEALRLYTLGSAWFSRDENTIGSIEVGKLADLAVLSDNYFEVAEDEIIDLSSVLTILGGRIVYTELDN